MDLLGKRPRLDLKDESWRIYSRHNEATPQFIGSNARIENSSVTEGCRIYGTVINSVIGANVTVEADAFVSDCVIMDGVRIREGAKVVYSIVDEKSEICTHSSVGNERKSGEDITVIAAHSRIV